MEIRPLTQSAMRHGFSGCWLVCPPWRRWYGWCYFSPYRCSVWWNCQGWGGCHWVPRGEHGKDALTWSVPTKTVGALFLVEWFDRLDRKAFAARVQCCWVVLWPMKVMGNDLHEPWRQIDISFANPTDPKICSERSEVNNMYYCIMPYLCNTWKVKSRTGSKFHRPDFQASTHVWLASQLEVSNVFQSCYEHYARIKCDTHLVPEFADRNGRSWCPFFSSALWFWPSPFWDLPLDIWKVAHRWGFCGRNHVDKATPVAWIQ